VLAGLCLVAPYDKVADLNATYAIVGAHGHRLASEPDVVRRLGVKIEVYQSDNIVFKQPATAAEACTGQDCVRYARACSPDGLTCYVEWGRPRPAKDPSADPILVTRAFSISAVSVDAMRRADEVLFVDGSAGADGSRFIPLAAMRAVSATPYHRACDKHYSGPDCVNLFVGILPPLPRRDR